MKAILLIAVLGTSTGTFAQGRSTPSTATISLAITEDLVERSHNVTGIAQVSGGPASGGAFELRVELADQFGRVVDRVDLKSTAGDEARAFEVPFSLDTTWFLTMVGTVHGSGRFSGSSSPSVHAQTVNVSIIPYPLDYDDYWANVWGGGSADSPEYFAALQNASVGLGHLYRDYDCAFSVVLSAIVKGSAHRP